MGKFDIAYAVNSLSRYSVVPREGHMLALQRVFGYLRQRSKGKILVDVKEAPVRGDLDILNTTIPSSALKKKHQACNYHKVRESIAAGFIKYGHIKSENNVADILTKPLGRVAFERLCNKYLFRRAQTVLCPDSGDKHDTKPP